MAERGDESTQSYANEAHEVRNESQERGCAGYDTQASGGRRDCEVGGCVEGMTESDLRKVGVNHRQQAAGTLETRVTIG